MKTQHTPGPWHIENGTDSRVYLVDNGKGHAIGELVYFDARKKADARLIAAAPDLLNALQTAAMALVGYTHRNEIIENALASARAAIEKATGGAE